MPAGPEFIALCQSQVALLTQGFGAALSIVYLTEELAEVADAKLVPVVVYPDAVANWGEDQTLALLSRRDRPPFNRPLLSSNSSSEATTDLPVLSSYPVEPPEEVRPLQAAEQALLRQQQVVLPLIHEDVVMGLLVTARADRAWTDSEQAQIQQIAETLAIACILDQRSQWLAHDLRQQRLLRDHKHDVLDDLLHQFRNPLTALRTFGKLLLKRLKAGDANRTVAEGIVRESDRLQELLQQFDSAIDLGEDDLLPLLREAQAATEAVDTSVDAIESPPVSKSPPLLPGATSFMGASLKLEAHPMQDVLEPLLESAMAIAQDRQLNLQAYLPAHLPPVRMDLRALREVLTNLIDNALKYTPSGGTIAVQVLRQPSNPQGRQAIVIADTGPGIPPQDLEHLFERHYRGVQAATDIPGTGLGLAIARDLVQYMQGEIQIFSPAATSGLIALPQLEGRPGTAVVVWLQEATYP